MRVIIGYDQAQAGDNAFALTGRAYDKNIGLLALFRISKIYDIAAQKDTASIAIYSPHAEFLGVFDLHLGASASISNLEVKNLIKEAVSSESSYLDLSE